MKIVKTILSKKGKEIVIRCPIMEDLDALCRYINELSEERTFVTFQGEKIELEDERKFLEGKLKDIEENRSVYLLALSNDILVGVSQVDLGTKTSKHIGTFGISIHRDFRSEGIGRAFMKTVLEEAVKEIKGLEIITLGIFGQNKKAYALYSSLGFVEYGKLEKGVKTGTSYDDHLWMYKRVK